MTGYERVQAVLRGDVPDYFPVVLHNFMLATRESGLKMRDYYSNSQNAARVHIEAVERYGLDGVLLDIDTAVIASAVGIPVDYPEDQPARCHTQFLKTIEEVDELKPVEISGNERIQIAVEQCRLVKQYFGDEIFIRGNCDQAPFSLASMMRTPAEWMMDLIISPEKAHQLLAYCTEVCRQFIGLVAETGVHMISNGDSPAGPDMIPPEMYREFAIPYEKALVETAHHYSLPYMIHICGNTNLILEDMKSVGFDAVELDYLTDMVKVHETFSDSVVFSGNIDPTGVIAYGSPELVKQKVRQLKKVYGDSPRLIVNAGCAIPPNTPSENIKALVETVREERLIIS